MKKLFVFSFLLLISSLVSNTYAEAFKFRASAIAYQITDDYGNWKKWSDWQNSSALIVYNDDRFKIYDDDFTLIFDTVSFENGDDLKYHCIDEEGKKCTIRVHKEGEDFQLYIEYTDTKIVYSVRKL